MGIIRKRVVLISIFCEQCKKHTEESAFYVDETDKSETWECDNCKKTFCWNCDEVYYPSKKEDEVVCEGCLKFNKGANNVKL